MGFRRGVLLAAVLALWCGGGGAGGAATAGPAVRAEDFDETRPVAVPAATPEALEFHRTGNALWLFARFYDLAVPLALLATGASARLRDLARRVGRSWFGTVVVYVVLFVAIVFAAELPLKYYAGFVRQHAYGLSRQTFADWLGDTLKAVGVEAVGAAVFGWVPFLLIRKFPRAWWLILGGLEVPFLAFLTLIAPVLIDPLFHEEGRMADAALERKILAMVERAGVSGSRVYEVDMSKETNTANAYVKGLLGTKRVVLWDTLTRDFDEREVLAVTGHELGHYVLNHIPKGIALSSLVVLAGLFWTDRAGRRILTRFSGRFGFDSLADVAATPLLLILMGVSSAVLAPVGMAYSRSVEHEADRFAIDLTGMNRSVARAFADLQRENLGVPRPAPVYRIWRASHPSVAQRIDFCNTYRPRTGDRSVD